VDLLALYDSGQGTYTIEARVYGIFDFGVGDYLVSNVGLDNVQLTPGDTASPTATLLSPADGATKVARTATVTATFSEPVQNVNTTTFYLQQKTRVKGDTSWTTVNAAVDKDTVTTDGTNWVLDPTNDLQKGTTYGRPSRSS
jgi:hypothetical protein